MSPLGIIYNFIKITNSSFFLLSLSQWAFGVRRRIDVDATYSRRIIRRIDVNTASFLRNVPAGLKVLAGDQWWPRTSGGRLRFAHAITHLLRHRFGHFVNSNKRNTHKKD